MLCLSGHRKLLLLYHFLAHQEGPIATNGTLHGTGYHVLFGCLGVILRWHICRVKFGTKDCWGTTHFLTRNAPKFSPKFLMLYFWGKSKWGLSNGGLRHSCTIVCNCAHLWPFGRFCKGIFSSQNDDNCRQLCTIEDKYLKPPFESPHLDFPEFCGSEKIQKNSLQISRQISLSKITKIHRRASAGAQGEGEKVIPLRGGGYRTRLDRKLRDSGTLSHPNVGRGEQAPTPTLSALLREFPVLLRADFVLAKPGRFTTRPLRVYVAIKLPFVM